METQFPVKSARIICHRQLSDVLLVRERPEYRLPRVTVVPTQRITPQVIKCVQNEWGIDGIMVFGSPIQDSSDPFFCVESDVGKAPVTMEWVPLSNLNYRHFKDESDHRCLQHVLDLATRYRAGTLWGPFARAGWLPDLKLWVSAALIKRGCTLTGPCEQLNGGLDFALIKFHTSTEQPVWFKAVGEANRREYGITTSLSKLCPAYFPGLLEVHPEWNGWLMEDGGVPLAEQEQLIPMWGQAISRLAELQVILAGRCDDLLLFGFSDRRIVALCNQLDAFFELVSQMMRQQERVPPRILIESELSGLKRCLRGLLFKLSDFGIPSSFGHADIGQHNILCGKRGTLFIDLAEVSLSHPFFTFQYLLDCFSRTHPKETMQAQIFRRTYAQYWTAFAPESAIQSSLEICTVLAPLWYAMSTDWTLKDAILKPTLGRFLRSLTRLVYSRAQSSGYLQEA